MRTVSSTKDKKSLEFGPFRLDAAEARLSRGGVPIELTPKALSLLLFLIEQRPRLVSRRELLDTLWADSYVDESNLTATIWMIRRALKGPSVWIETRPKHGYRFVGEVREVLVPVVADESRRPRTLAVLPLRPLQPGSGDEVLEVGVADTLITRLGGLPDLVVRPLSAVHAHRGTGQDAIAAGRQLGADAVLEGTLQREDATVRVNVRLLAMPDGAILWGRSFDVPFTGLFAVEDAIAGHVASALSSSLTARDRARLTRRHVPPVEAYRLYLEGRAYWHAWPSPGYEQSRACFERAIALDPEFASAYSGLAHYLGLGAAMGVLRPAEAWPRMEAAMAMALHLDPGLAEAHNTVAAYRLYVQHDWAGAEDAFQQALGLNSNDAEVRNHYALSLSLFGRTVDALEQIDHALRIDPLASRFRRNRAFVLYQAGLYEQAIEECGRLAELDPEYSYGHELHGDAFEQLERWDDALEQWAMADGGRTSSAPRARKTDRGSFVAAVRRLWERRLAAMLRRREAGEFGPAIELARAHVRMGQFDAALDWLEKAAQERNKLILDLPLDPQFDGLRGRRRFEQVVAGLPNRDASRGR